MLHTPQAALRASLVALALSVRISPAVAQNPPTQERGSSSALLDSVRRMLARREKECQRPFARPPELPFAALRAKERVRISATTTLYLTASVTVDFRPPVDPDFSIFPRLRCAPSTPLELILHLHTDDRSGRLSAVEIDSVWIRHDDQQYATAPVRTVADEDADTHLSRRIYRAPLWVKGRIDIFVRLKAPSLQWLAIRDMPVDVLK
jgi:hypothetical protein